MSYDKAYKEWDEMTPSERMDWCSSIGEPCSAEEANADGYWLSENRYCFWVTIREILNEQ